MSTRKKSSPDSIVREIKQKTRRKYSAEDKIRIVLEGLRGEQGITDLCRYHEAIDNVTPSDRFFGRDMKILEQRRRIKTETMRQRKEIFRLFMINDLMGNLS